MRLFKENDLNTEEKKEKEDTLLEVDPSELSEVLLEVPETKIDVIGTFQTIPFKIEFISYIVRLEQRIRVSDADAEYALSVQ